MTRAGGGDISTRRDLLGSPGWQEKLKHYLLNHVRVETNICWPSVQPSDPSELLAPPPRDVSIMSSQPSRCYPALPSPAGWPGKGWEGSAVQGQHCRTHSRHAATEIMVKLPALLCQVRLLSYSGRFSGSPISSLIRCQGP